MGRRRFALGLLCGVALVFAAEFALNKTSFADWLISPLLLADSAGQADAIVALGAGVTENCKPNQNAVRRVLLATRLWREKRAPYVLFTGGSPDRRCPVARVMADLAEEIGLPESAIRIEPASQNTKENAEESARLLRAAGARRVLLVTDRLHMRRAQSVFARAGFDVGRASVPIYEGHVDNVSMLRAGMREFAGLAYYRLRGWTGPRAAGEAAPAQAVATAGREHAARASETAQETSMESATRAEGPIVVLGASYAGGWPLESVGGVPIINKGVTGQQSFELLARFEPDVVAARPRAVILWGFINDIFRSAPGDSEQVQARIRDSYTRMIALARQNGIRPVLATELTMGVPDTWKETLASWVGWALGKESYQDRINRQVVAVNEWIKETARREGLLLLDISAALSDASGRRRQEFTQPDGSHVSPAGYAALDAYARPLLQQHVVNRQENR